MKDVEPGRRSARLKAAVALVHEHDGKARWRVAEAAIEGIVPDRAWPHIRPGFPYRSVLFLPERGRYLAELTDDEAARISQRRTTLEELRDDLVRIARSSTAQAAGRS
jgi:inosine/xanthosine triphosphate pyrophosphatase family protein